MLAIPSVSVTIKVNVLATTVFVVRFPLIKFLARNTHTFRQSNEKAYEFIPLYTYIDDNVTAVVDQLI